MAKQYLYLGEAAGGRIIRVGGAALTQIKTSGTEDVLLDVQTWDMVPMGAAGDVVFRQIIATVRYTNGFSIKITPYIDGVALTPQNFSGAGADTFPCQAYVARRGARLAVRVQQLTRLGDLELVDITAAFQPIRQVP
jgi:hypothetical protein